MKIGKKSTSSASYAKATSGYGQSSRQVERKASVDDSIEVSSDFSVLQQAIASVNALPDIRSEAISGVQQELREGSYHRDEEEVAEKVIEEHLETTKATP
jgi:flagellar biosynthesis anti-sigma factor FlgM